MMRFVMNDLPQQITALLEESKLNCASPEVALAVVWVGLVQMSSVGLQEGLAHDLVCSVWMIQGITGGDPGCVPN